MKKLLSLCLFLAALLAATGCDTAPLEPMSNVFTPDGDQSTPADADRAEATDGDNAVNPEGDEPLPDGDFEEDAAELDAEGLEADGEVTPDGDLDADGDAETVTCVVPGTLLCQGDSLLVCDGQDYIVLVPACPYGCGLTTGGLNCLPATPADGDADLDEEAAEAEAIEAEAEAPAVDGDEELEDENPPAKLCTPASCPFGGNPCKRDDTCVPATGACLVVEIDNIPCGEGGTCAGGVCVTPDLCSGVVCAAPDQCHLAGVCNPATGVCGFQPKQDGSSCEEGNLCTTGDTCTNGACVAGPPKACDDHNACTTDSCAPATGACVNTAANPACVPCSTVAQCEDLNPCTTDTCSAGVCGHSNQAVGTACSDGNACNGAETCNASGVCQAGTPVVCAAPDNCHLAGVCNPATGVCSNPLRDCDDGNDCTEDSCDPVAGDPITGCKNDPAPAGLVCDDGDPCNSGETCSIGACTGGTASPDGTVCGPAPTDQCITGVCRDQSGILLIDVAVTTPVEAWAFYTTQSQSVSRYLMAPVRMTFAVEEVFPGPLEFAARNPTTWKWLNCDVGEARLADVVTVSVVGVQPITVAPDACAAWALSKWGGPTSTTSVVNGGCYVWHPWTCYTGGQNLGNRLMLPAELGQ